MTVYIRDEENCHFEQRK